jgi:hypothetical protein
MLASTWDQGDIFKNIFKRLISLSNFDFFEACWVSDH